MIKVSVIVAVYNLEKYISVCIESLIGQTLKQIEIIVINDGSTDYTGKIVRQFLKKDKRIRYRRINNSGLGAARNAGLKIAEGEYIGFIDGDDFADRNMYETLYSLAKKKEVDIVSCLHTCFWDDNSKENYIYPNYPFKSDTILFPTSAPDKFKALLNYSACNKIFLKKKFVPFPVGVLHEDIPVMFDMYSNSQSVLCTNKPFHYYRQGRAGKITEDGSRKRFDIFKISAIVERKIKQKKLNQGWVDYFLNWRNQYYLSIYKKIRPGLRKNYLARVKKELQLDNFSFISYIKKINKQKIRSFFLIYGFKFFLNTFSVIDTIVFHIMEIYKKHIMSRLNHD